MMKKYNDPFTSFLPHLDLHGETRESSIFLINSFINDNYKMRCNKVVIIHGKGSGILKSCTKDVLNKSKLVSNYYIDPLNDGQTIVEINLKNNISKMSQNC